MALAGERSSRFWLDWLAIGTAILYWELLLSLETGGGPTGGMLWFLLFLPAQALIPAALSGWRRGWQNVAAFFPVLLLSIYYFAQLLYHRIFGSLISLSMVGVGGDAMTGFAWALRGTLRRSWLWLTACLFPIPLLAFRLIKERSRVLPLRYRPLLLILACVLWLAAGRALVLGGTGRHTAYEAYYSGYTDTDTTASRLGVLSTTLLEAQMRITGNGEEDTSAAISHEAGAASDILASVPNPPSASITDEMPDASEEPAPPPDTSPQVLKEIDFTALEEAAEDPSLKELCRYFSGVSGSRRNAYTGLLRDYNLIYICAEAFFPYGIDPEITPTLYRMSNEGVILTNYYNSFPNTTTNGEFAFLTGQWPDVSRISDNGNYNGSFSQSAENYMPYGLGHLFSELGVESFAFHNYYGEYYNRRASHSNLGYQCKFMDDGMSFTSEFPASDLEMLEQTIPDYIGKDRFNVYYMTFSGHGEYTDFNVIARKNLPWVDAHTEGRQMDLESRSYLACCRELDLAMELLLNRLEEAGQLDRTLIVLTGDHYPYYMPDESAAILAGHRLEPRIERFKSTCFLWFLGEGEPIYCDNPCCNVDILPTVLNLLGIDFDSRLLAGTDVFSDSFHVAMLYNRCFITDRLIFVTRTGETRWLEGADGMDEEERQEYLNLVQSLLEARYAASLAINNTDFYRFVWSRSGLLDAE